MAKKKRPVTPARKPKATPAPRSASDQTGFGLHANVIERALLTGDSRGLMEDYFGPEAYSQLRDMARDAATRSVRGGPRVLILPGIMGSTLARKGVLGIDNVLWVDPIEIAFGKLTDLKVGGGASKYHASGVILLAYLKLKLRLKISGFDADFFPFDWRLSIADAGKLLAAAIKAEAAAQVYLVAHSMGGLVARAALPAAGKKVARLIMMGTPNYGSFAPAQVIRGAYDVVQKIASLDQKNSAETLCGEVFNTFPGLYEMLPSPEKFSALNLYKVDAWPVTRARPRANLLAAVKPVIDRLAKADSRFYLIAGVNQDTVTGLRMDGGEFSYEISPDGDGTVPLAFARLADIPDGQTYFVEEGHGSLPNNGAVETAVADLLAKGATSALPTTPPPSRRATRFVSEGEVLQMAQRAPGVGQLGSADYRHLLDAVAAPPAAERAATPSGSQAAGPGTGSPVDLPQQFHQLTIGRRRQRRIELTLAHGSITDVDSRAYVVGVFRNVAPSGASKAIDVRLDGAITEFTARRMFNGDMGSVFTVPVGRNQLAADMVLFAGLGAFDRFNTEVQQLVAENVIRVLIRSRVDEFATVLFGAGSGQSAGTVLQSLLTGFLRGLKDADPHSRFRSITLCETDPVRFADMKSELYRLAGTSLFEDVELTLDEVEVPPTERPAALALQVGPEPVYMIIREEGTGGARVPYRVSILGSGMKAAVVTAVREIEKTKLDALLQEFDQAVSPSSGVTDVKPFGVRFADLVLPAEVCTVLESLKERHLVVVHDAVTSRIPWETFTINKWTAAMEGGLSRRYLADNLPVATWLEARRTAPNLNLLLVVNPLGDLADAEKEGDRIMNLVSSTAAIDVTQLRQKDATKAAVLAALRTGEYDCVHYAGHAFFDPQGPGRSGLICAGREILMGSDLMGISNLPSLVFFNACEAGRVRGGKPVARKVASSRAVESAGVAEALMRGGIANFMSTYWPVGDDAAKTFSVTFYQQVLTGVPIGAALLEGRKEVFKLGDRDWADYLLYGNFDFVLKDRKA
jgi:pimeloyl-ACP methyl ester carboxylesterase